MGAMTEDSWGSGPPKQLGLRVGSQRDEATEKGAKLSDSSPGQRSATWGEGLRGAWPTEGTHLPSGETAGGHSQGRASDRSQPCTV